MKELLQLSEYKIAGVQRILEFVGLFGKCFGLRFPGFGITSTLILRMIST